MEGGGTVNPVSSGQPSSILGGGTPLNNSKKEEGVLYSYKTAIKG